MQCVKVLCVPGSPHPTTNHWKSQHPFHGRLTSNMVCKHCEHQVSGCLSVRMQERPRSAAWLCGVGREDAEGTSERISPDTQAASAPGTAQLLSVDRLQVLDLCVCLLLAGTADLRSGRCFALDLRVLTFSWKTLKSAKREFFISVRQFQDILTHGTRERPSCTHGTRERPS